ncbi:MAG: o-succinylbenzoate synthase [Opitutaceae bacterium]|nr:o-succinylbenzoate synthase [Opitutaceae bacterium]
MMHRLQYRRYRLPFRVPLRTAHGVWTEREGLLLRLEDETGRVGWGEAAVLPWFGTETADEAEAACRALGEYFDGAELGRVPAGLGCLRQALTAALDDGAMPAAAKPLPVAALLPAGRTALLRVGPLAEAGYRVFKWKVGVEPAGDELALFDDLCARLPDGGRLRLDANGAWDRRTAEKWLERAAERPVEFVEQPCFAKASHGADLLRRTEDLLLGLAADYPTPLALDESLVGEADVGRWLERGWRGVFVLKPSLCGEVGATMARLAAAKAMVVFSSALETAVGAKAALTAAFRWPGEPRALGFGVWPLFADGRLDGPPAAPFLRPEDVQRINAEAVWSALS